MEEIELYDIAVVGCGPAGMCAAIEASSIGARVCIIDKNFRAGGQLFKQIHKFFGSSEHYAGSRGFEIGEKLLDTLKQCRSVDIFLESIVFNIDSKNNIFTLWVSGKSNKFFKISSKNIIISTGASEKPLFFEGWTLPGVMAAGAVQTLVNIYGVLPGKKILMVGSGNVGLIVSYQLLQAGAEVAGVVEIKNGIGGYGVHADKLRKNSVKFYFPYVLEKVEGQNKVEKAIIYRVDKSGKKIVETKKTIDTDIICLAVGLEPYSGLCRILGCGHVYNGELGGFIPAHNEDLESSVSGVFISGDVSGIEEATAAMEEGRLAAISSCFKLNMLDERDFFFKKGEIIKKLDQLRSGSYGRRIKAAKNNIFTYYDRPSDKAGARKQNFETNKPDVDEKLAIELKKIKNEKVRKFALVECFEDIACNPCETICPRGVIKVGKKITNIPRVDYGNCNGCGLCMAQCPGLVIRVIDLDNNLVDLPYEFLPVPAKGESVFALDNKGNILGTGTIKKIMERKSFNKTSIVTVEVDKKYIFLTRSVRCIENDRG